MTTSAVPNVASRAGRLVRAMELVQKGKVTHLGGTRYLIKSGEDHWVDLMGDPPCYCPDAEHRTVDCKHELAARLHKLNHIEPKIVKSLADWITVVTKA